MNSCLLLEQADTQYFNLLTDKQEILHLYYMLYAFFIFGKHIRRSVLQMK